MRLVWVSFVPFILAFSAGCPRPGNVQCLESGNCDRFPGGICQATPSGNQWCAYPDSECPSGYRYSDLDVGDGVSGHCVMKEDPGTDAGVDGGTQVHTLTVKVGGNGSGNVISQPEGIDCSSGSCTATFALGTTVQLNATPTGSAFLGWSDGCSGAAGCTINLNENTSVGALFGIPGEALWFNQVGSTGEDFAREIFVDSQDNVYAGGSFSNTVTIGGRVLTSAGSTDAFVAKLDSSTGVAAWAVRFGSTDVDSVSGIAVDSNGDVIVLGMFRGTVNFGGMNLVSAGDNDVYLVKLDGATGTHIWSQRFGGTGNDGSGGAVVIDSSGSIVITGSFGSPMITFGGPNFSNAGTGGDLYLAKFANGNGSHLWSRRMGGTSADGVNGLAIDFNNDLILTGQFSGTTNLGGQNITGAGGTDAYVAKYRGTDGLHLFSLRYGSTSNDYGAGVAVDGEGKIFVTGTYQGTVSFGGPTPFTSAGGQDIFLVRLSISGAHEWSKSFGSANLDVPGGIAVDSSGNVTIVGTFAGTLNLGGSNLSAAGGAEVFVGTFDGATGNHLGSVRQGGTGQENGMGVAVASDRRIYCVGHFDGFVEFGGVGHTGAGSFDGFIVGLGPLK